MADIEVRSRRGGKHAPVAAGRSDRRRDSHRVAFALGGLAGGNGFGAGFLEAARLSNIRPTAISCTSGMIVWTARFLAGGDLAQHFREEQGGSLAANALPPPVASALVGLVGVPGIFRPAVPEYWMRWLQLPLDPRAQTLANAAWPVQTALPVRPESYFDAIAQTLNGSDVAVLFNAFCPQDGEEYLFLNPAAMQLLAREPGQRHGNQVFHAISAAAVRAALHLYAYGYDEQFEGRQLVDGAYHRQFILEELCEIPGASKPARVWMVRPQNSRWLGPMPGNHFEQRDLETEIGMNSSYAGQVRRIDLVNRLLAEGKLAPGSYQPVELRPFEFNGQRGYFDYFNESQAVFDMACHEALAALRTSLLQGQQP
jgi:hypothetical protein